MSGRSDPLASASTEEVEEAAAAWIWRRACAGWTDCDEAELETWLEVSTHHAAAFWRLEAIWERTGRLHALRAPAGRMKSHVSPHRRWLVLGTAAAVVVLGLVGISSNLPEWQTNHPQTFSTAVGGRATIRLADGSRVELNTDTVLTADVRTDRRMLELKKGEAFFQVEHDRSRPFVVRVAGHRVIDLGTKFSIRAAGDDLTVTLVEGRARLEAASAHVQPHSTDLTPGEVVVATPTSLSISKLSSRDMSDSLAWKRGLLVFKHVALADAAEEFNRYNKSKLIVGPEVAQMKINGTFEAGSVDAFARMAQYAMGLRIEKTGAEIHLMR